MAYEGLEIQASNLSIAQFSPRKTQEFRHAFVLEEDDEPLRARVCDFESVPIQSHWKLSLDQPDWEVVPSL